MDDDDDDDDDAHYLQDLGFEVRSRSSCIGGTIGNLLYSSLARQTQSHCNGIIQPYP